MAEPFVADVRIHQDQLLETIEFSDPPSIAEARPGAPAPNSLATIVARPSVATGSSYKQVSKAYIDAVHSVLTGERGAPEAAADLEKQLIDITGFNAGLPKTIDRMAP